VLNSDAWMYGGSGRGNLGGVDADPVPLGDQFNSLLIALPPLSIVFLRYQGKEPFGGAR
jgi:1,4-alpha-glucan branching enzyme